MVQQLESFELPFHMKSQRSRYVSPPAAWSDHLRPRQEEQYYSAADDSVVPELRRSENKEIIHHLLRACFFLGSVVLLETIALLLFVFAYTRR